ncbi:hypothetical protein P4V41_07015 [Fictibacillus nanhaiensis]|nr:hypothetical protein [Fictibacillus nanhaiensis]
MTTKDKMDEMLKDIRQAIESNDLEETLTLIGMLERAEQLEEWLAE